MINYWIIIARRYNQTLEDARRYIEKNEIWDFVSSNSDQNRTPSYALELKEGNKVLFYLSKEDRDGKSLSPYPYPIFFAKATLKSEFIDNKDKRHSHIIQL